MTMSGPQPTCAASAALGVTSGQLSDWMFTGTPVAAVNFFVFSAQMASSALTNPVQRSSSSFASFSGLNGEASAAEASKGKPPAIAPAPIPAAESSRNRRRSGWVMGILSRSGASAQRVLAIRPLSLPFNREEVEVAAALGTEDVLGVQFGIPATRDRRTNELGQPRSDLRIGEGDVEAFLAQADADAVAVSNCGERTADRSFRRDVQHDGAVCGAAHARVADSQHVANAAREQLLGDPEIAGFGHPGADGARVLQHEDVVGLDVEIGRVDAGRHVGEIAEHDRTAFVLE